MSQKIVKPSHMNDAQIQQALQSLDAAVTQLEEALSAYPKQSNNNGDDELRAQHTELKREIAATVAELDSILEAADRV